MTSNKSQGQTIGTVGIYLASDFFAHGQLYVAMSRVQSPGDLKFYKPDDKDGNSQNYTENVVYKEIFSMWIYHAYGKVVHAKLCKLAQY